MIYAVAIRFCVAKSKEDFVKGSFCAISAKKKSIKKMFTNWLTPTTAATPPPDVIIEIGPPPHTRFIAHSTLLSAHSGYLRSAIRPEERNFDTPVYLPNVTAEQFAPLLTYMYTGYLDLSIENIFGVLLATHVLHMPRALEICRAFLSRTQSEGYLGGGFLPTLGEHKSMETSGVKIIRPIASKASMPGVGFISPPTSNILLPSRDTQFKSIHHDRERSPIPTSSKQASSPPKVLDISKKSTRHKLLTTSTPTQIERKEIREVKETHETKTKSKSVIVEESVKVEENYNKIIIDIASCDGPVRFRRVLNEAYGKQPILNQSNNRPAERTQQNLVTSFHLQMAKTINEQRQLQQQNATYEESENSQEIIVNDPPNASTISKTSDEVYSCVYCKHTFKSQYCYQKHAKRHINPLSIDNELVVDTLDSGSEKEEKGSSSGGSAIRREVRPLDMNVQYYPCKTCGSKFPSYYFVHKHRKLCHANEEN